MKKSAFHKCGTLVKVYLPCFHIESNHFTTGKVIDQFCRKYAQKEGLQLRCCLSAEFLQQFVFLDTIFIQDLTEQMQKLYYPCLWCLESRGFRDQIKDQSSRTNSRRNAFNRGYWILGTFHSYGMGSPLSLNIFMTRDFYTQAPCALRVFDSCIF